MSAADTRAALRDALLARDLGAIDALLAEDAVLRSPVIKYPFEGRRAVAGIYEIVLDRFADLEPVSELGEADGLQMLRFRSSVLGRPAEVVTLLSTNAEDHITEVVIYVRGLVALAAVGAVMGAGLGRRRSRFSWLFISVMSRPLPHVIAAFENLLPRLIYTKGEA